MSVPPPYPSSSAQPGPTSGPPKRKLSGCAIAAIIAAACGVLGIPLIAILAAISIPAYQDYTTRTKVMQAHIASFPVQKIVAGYRDANGMCPDAAAFAAQAPNALPLTSSGKPDARAAVVWAAPEGGQCAFDLRFENLSANSEGKTLRLVEGEDGRWSCSGGDLPIGLRPPACR